MKNFNELINKEEMGISREFFQIYFSFQRPSEMLKFVCNTNDKKKSNDLTNVIKNGLSDLKNEIKKMSENEIEIEKPDKTVDIIEEVLQFNRQNQEGPGLKILTHDQMLSILPITLAQLKLKNVTRQLMYPLYRSKKLPKMIYNNFINTT